MESFHLRGKRKCGQKKIISEFLWTFPTKHWIRVDIKFKVKIIILSERAIRILCKLLLTISLRAIKYDTKIRLLIIATFSFLTLILHRGLGMTFFLVSPIYFFHLSLGLLFPFSIWNFLFQFEFQFKFRFEFQFKFQLHFRSH